MSILQEYEENERIIGKGRIKAIEQYIEYCKKNNKDVMYSDIVYKRREYALFSKWFDNEIKPFLIMHHGDDCYSVSLDENCFLKYAYCNGYILEDSIKRYVESNFSYLKNDLKYDSENSMFCVYTSDIRTAEDLAYELSKLYKNKEFDFFHPMNI